MGRFWKIDDGRIWSLAAARFVSVEDVDPEGLAPLWDSGVVGGIDLLKKAIMLHGGSLGELA